MRGTIPSSQYNSSPATPPHHSNMSRRSQQKGFVGHRRGTWRKLVVQLCFWWMASSLEQPWFWVYRFPHREWSFFRWDASLGCIRRCVFTGWPSTRIMTHSPCRLQIKLHMFLVIILLLLNICDQDPHCGNDGHSVVNKTLATFPRTLKALWVMFGSAIWG